MWKFLFTKFSEQKLYLFCLFLHYNTIQPSATSMTTMNISKWRAVPLALLGLLSVAWISFMDAGAGDKASLRSIASGSLVVSTDTWEDPRNLMADPGLNKDEKSLTLDSPTSEKARTVLSKTFDDKNSVVFLIAFGEAATSSTYVERSIMSLRRRGEFQGRVLVLTDAPDERYHGFFDEKVIIMHPKEEHMKTDFLYRENFIELHLNLVHILLRIE